jgi:hypothetical protein
MSRVVRIVTGILLCVSSFCVAQSPDQRAAESVLGPHWKEVSRVAGMIFTGTVLSTERQAPTQAQPVPTVQAKILVKHAIAGVHPGQVVILREWAGIWAMQRSMGSRPMLFLFYPPSAAGLTSPVGGPLGQVPLDSSGNNVAAWLTPPKERNRMLGGARAGPPTQPFVTVGQLERAIVSVREGKE